MKMKLILIKCTLSKVFNLLQYLCFVCPVLSFQKERTAFKNKVNLNKEQCIEYMGGEEV
jgi:hypothetical protein